MFCQAEAREAGLAYPRTCPTCKLGPCQKFGAKPLQSLSDAQAEIARLTAALERTEANRDAILADLAEVTAALEHQRHETGKRQSQDDRWRHERDTEIINRQQAEAERDAALAAIDRAKAEGMRGAAELTRYDTDYCDRLGGMSKMVEEPEGDWISRDAILSRAKDMEAEPRAAAQEKGGAA